MGDGTMQTPMYAMYKAGKQDIPAESEIVSRASNELYTVMEAFNLQSAYAGDPALMTSMLEIGGEVYNQLRSAAVSLDNAAIAVIATADDFRNTDDRARADYQNLSSSLKNTTVYSHPHDPKLPDLTDDGGAPNPDVDRPYGHGGIQTPPGADHPLPPTPDPTSPTDDKSTRDGVAQHDHDTNPVPTLPTDRH